MSARAAGPPRRALLGADAVAAALDAGEAVRVILARRGANDPAVNALLARARAAGIPVHRVGERHLARLARSGTPVDLLAMAGRAPHADVDEVLKADGAAWLLVGVRFPGNAGFVIRSAEVSGGDGVFIDADFSHTGRRETLRQSMRADRYLPVHWLPADAVVERAAAAGRRLVAIEVGGKYAPWEVDLTPPSLFIVGGEDHGVPAPVLDRCDCVLHIPMAGFIGAYNLQTAVAAVVSERFRQLTARP